MLNKVNCAALFLVNQKRSELRVSKGKAFKLDSVAFIRETDGFAALLGMRREVNLKQLQQEQHPATES